MKRIYKFIYPRVIAGFVAATALIGSVNVASGAESSAQFQPSQIAPGQPAENLRLPPIPNLNAVRWLGFERSQKGPLIDTLVTPPPANLPMWPDSLIAAGKTARNG